MRMVGGLSRGRRGVVVGCVAQCVACWLGRLVVGSWVANGGILQWGGVLGGGFQFQATGSDCAAVGGGGARGRGSYACIRVRGLGGGPVWGRGGGGAALCDGLRFPEGLDGCWCTVCLGSPRWGKVWQKRV